MCDIHQRKMSFENSSAMNQAGYYSLKPTFFVFRGVFSLFVLVTSFAELATVCALRA